MPVQYGTLEFERLGHASVRIETDDGTVVYVDPWGEVPEREPGGDMVFLTHDDFDHYDPEAIGAVAGPDATIAAYERIDTGVHYDTFDPIETDAEAFADDLEESGIRVELF